MARIIGALLIFSVLTSGVLAAAPTCQSITSNVNSCVAYIEGRATGGPSTGCCEGMKTIAAQVKGKHEDLVHVCNCLKTALAQLGNQVVAGRVSDLPNKCGVPNMIPIDNNNYDCSKISMEM